MYFLPVIFSFACIFFPRFLFPALMLMALIAGVRKDVLGYDYSQYQIYYEGFSSFGNYLSYEYGFAFLVDVFSSFGFSFHFFIFVVSLFFHYSLYFALSKIKELVGLNVGLLLLLFISSGAYYWLAYVITRQSISTGVFYFILPSVILGSKKIRASAYTFAGSLFHISNIITLPVIFIRRKFVFAGLLFIPSLLIIFNYAFGGSKYVEYLNSKNVGSLYLVEAACLLFISLYLKRKSNTDINDFSFKLSAVFFTFYLFAILFGVNTTRLLIGLYLVYYIPLVILVGRLEINARITALIIILIIASARVHLFISGFGELGYPYTSIFN